MNVLHLAAECAPLAKVGGLADVIGSLPAATVAHGIAPSVLLPLYGGREGAVGRRAGGLSLVYAGATRYDGQLVPYAVHRAARAPVPTFLLETAAFDAPWIYAGPDGEALPPERYALFQRAALDWLASGAAPTVDLLHLHDHHAGLVPALLAGDPEAATLRRLPTVFTVHSADHHGIAPWSVWERFGVPVREAEPLMVEDDLNPLKAGVSLATAVTTVSPSYADDLATDPATSRGLVETFRAARARTTGILSGIDTALWDPATDPHLPHRYSADDLAGKARTKADLTASLALDGARPLVAYIGRLMPEKGTDLLTEGIERTLAQTDAAIAVLGAGDGEQETAVRGLASMMHREGHADRLSATVGFDEALAHRLFAAADVFVMPSRRESGGLAARYAMRYGAPPVVHATGGLRDAVQPWDGTSGTGFRFERFTAEAFVEAVRAALAVYADPRAWTRLVANAMAADFSWDAPAARYAEVYRHAASRGASNGHAGRAHAVRV